MRSPTALRLLLVGGVLTSVGLLIQAFTITAYARGAGASALEAHRGMAVLVLIGELSMIAGISWGWRTNRRGLRVALGLLLLAFAQIASIGETDSPGGWGNGLHGMLALLVFAAGAMGVHRALRELRSAPAN